MTGITFSNGSFVATWPTDDGGKSSSSFAIGTYGEEKALKLALAVRKKKEQELGIEIFDPMINPGNTKRSREENHGHEVTKRRRLDTE